MSPLNMTMMMMMIMVMMMVGESRVAADTNAVMAYWEDGLHSASMPSTLRAMLTPLDSQQAVALRDQIVEHPDFLPAHAPAFCQATRMQCQRPTYKSTSAGFKSYTSGDANGGDFFFRHNLTLVAGAKIQVSAEADKDSIHERAFLPRELAQLFPITGKTGALPRMATMLGIPESALPSMEATVAHCDQKVILPGEERACISSMEDLTDFATSIMASSQYDTIVVDASEVPRTNAQTTHTVMAVKPITQDPMDKYVACHDMLFPFRLFICHYIHQTKLFLATIQAENGNLYNRVAICHYNTSSLNPSHSTFSDLYTKPGESEACHWVGNTSICFVPQSSTPLL